MLHEPSQWIDLGLFKKKKPKANDRDLGRKK
jgi:hypothetical protein